MDLRQYDNDGAEEVEREDDDGRGQLLACWLIMRWLTSQKEENMENDKKEIRWKVEVEG